MRLSDVLVLPSHGLPFRGLAGRIADLAAHHEERLEVTRDACREPAHAAAVTAALFPRRLDQHQMMFAVGEALAHLNRMVTLGQVDRRLVDDRWSFRRI